MTQNFTLTLSCPQRPGIVHAVSSFLFSRNCDIAEHQQFDETRSQAFFLRTKFVCADDTIDIDQLTAEFGSVATEFNMNFRFVDSGRPRVVVMVSKMGHCLNDLIFRWRAGTLGGELVAVVSNHEVLRPMAEAAGLPFVHIPVTPTTKSQAEADLLALVDELEADLVVLARYMQVLSDDACKALHGRAINIHHSFLPGFKGAKPYHQAFDRGVKNGRRDSSLRDARPRRGADHRAGGYPHRPRLRPAAPGHRRSGRRGTGPLARGAVALREPGAAARAPHGRLQLTRRRDRRRAGHTMARTASSKPMTCS